MFNFNTLSHKTLISIISPNPSPFSLLHFSTKTSSDSTPFAFSYLTQNFGFSPQLASKICSIYKPRFKTNHKPESVVNFFRNHGFSDTQSHNVIAKAPWLLSCDPAKRVLPKFQFFLSKGASNTDIVNLISKSPAILMVSLENQLVPSYELAYRFLKSHKHTLACLIQRPAFFGGSRMASNIRLLIENGVSESNIARLLQNNTQILEIKNMMKLVDELKDLGFNPSKSAFATAFTAKVMVTKTLWNEKVDAYEKWGWSEKDVLEAFKKYPYIMLVSITKINLVMSSWVNEMGWDAKIIAKTPYILSYSLEKRIIPRAAVVQFILSKGLRHKNASLASPFQVPENIFYDRCIKCFENESSYLLKLYEEKLNLAYNGDKNACHD